MTALVLNKAWIVITFVQILEDAREYFGLLVGQVDATIGRIEELGVQDLSEVWRMTEDIFMAGEEPLDGANNDCDDGGCQAGALHHRAVLARLQLLNHMLLLRGVARKRSLRLLAYLAGAVLRTSKGALSEHFDRRE